MASFNPSSPPSPQWRIPSAYSPPAPRFEPSFTPPSFNFQSPIPPSYNGRPLVGRANPLSSPEVIPPLSVGPSTHLTPPSLSITPPTTSFGANPLSGRIEPLNPAYLSTAFPPSPNFSPPTSFQPSFSYHPGSLVSSTPSLPQGLYRAPQLNLQTPSSLPGRVDVISPLVGPTQVPTHLQDFRVGSSSSDPSRASWMNSSYPTGISPLPSGTLVPFSFDRPRTTFHGQESETSPRRLSQFPSLLTPGAEAQLKYILQNNFEETLKTMYIMSAPPEPLIPIRGWIPATGAASWAFQMNPQTTVFFDPVAFNDFIQRATPSQKEAAQTQLAQFIQSSRPASDHSTAIVPSNTAHSSSQPIDQKIPNEGTQQSDFKECPSNQEFMPSPIKPQIGMIPLPGVATPIAGPSSVIRSGVIGGSIGTCIGWIGAKILSPAEPQPSENLSHAEEYAVYRKNFEEAALRAERHKWTDVYAPGRPLPMTEDGIPIPDTNAPHTQLGKREGSKGTYPQAREFDSNGNPVRDIDFTDHGRPDRHSNPHQHRPIPNPSGGTPQRGDPEPLPEWNQK